MHTIINAQCIDQQLSVVSSPTVASGGKNETVVKFEFCPMWDGFAKTAVFWNNEAMPYQVLIDSNNECVVPSEVTAKEGRMSFSVFGVNGDTTRTSTVLHYTVKKGSPTDGGWSDPTPSVYEQILSELAITQQAVSGVVDSAKSAEQSAKDAADYAKNAIPNTEKGARGGVAPLDENAKISTDHLPSDVARLGSNGKISTADLPIGGSLGIPQLDGNGKIGSNLLPSLDYIPTSYKGAANGVASLDKNGVVPLSQTYKPTILIFVDIDNLTIESGAYSKIENALLNGNPNIVLWTADYYEVYRYCRGTASKYLFLGGNMDFVVVRSDGSVEIESAI